MTRGATHARSVVATFAFGDYVGLVPGLLVSLAVSIPASAAAARVLRVRRAVGWVIVVSLGVIVSATLTPSRTALEYGAAAAPSCDLSRAGLASLTRLLDLNETSLNVLLFVPLGAGIGVAPRSWRKATAIAAAAALPFAIEATQLFAPTFGRACQSGDVVDNLTGLVLGLAVGTVVARVAAVEQAGPTGW